jgi:hypothetical protein
MSSIRIIFLILTFHGFAQDTIKVMWYNISNFPEINASRVAYLKTIVQYEKPDILAVCEITSPSGASDILNKALNVGTAKYAMANYVNGPDDENMLFYNSSKLGYIKQKEIEASPRQFNEYVLYYKDPSLTALSDTTYIYFYAVHLKAGTTDTDKNDRVKAATLLRDYLISRPYSENTILGGDLNIYGSSESAYSMFTGELQANLFDPVGLGEYHSNPLFAMHHTQSTRMVSIDGGATGGMDDRFDMLLFSQDMRFGLKGIQYMNESYKALGQDGKQFNAAINSAINYSVPPNVLNALYYMSDHLPVVMELIIGETADFESVGIQDNWIQIFPNPTNDKVVLTVSDSSPFYAELKDMSGRTVCFSRGQGTQIIDLSHLVKGCYFLCIHSNKGSISRKVVLD